MKSSIYLFSVVLLFIFLSACNGISSNKTLPLKAAIVYKMGGAQPVARTTFYLSKKDLETAAKEAGVKFGTTVAAQWAMNSSFQSATGKNTTSQFIKAIEPHIVSTVTTDFDGTAKFENVSPGTYYVIGITQTRSGWAVWNVPINTEQTQTIILDQNNAAHTS